MSNNHQQWSAVLVILFALITTLILCNSNGASEVSHYSSLWGQIRQLVNLKKWGITDGYIPILARKTLPSQCNQCDCHQLQPPDLLGTKLAPEVKQAECTICMNDTPTTGYSDHLVGNKTTFRVGAHSRVSRVWWRL